MLAKRPIYNHKLECAAFEVLFQQGEKSVEEISNLLRELIMSSETHLPLFIPYTLKSVLDDFANTIDNPIILKLPAEDVDSRYSLTEVKESDFSIALVISAPQQLAWLNCAEYIGLTEELMNSADVTKVVNFSKDKHRKVIAYSLAEPLNFERCKRMNMDYYCGEFLFQPVDTDKSNIAANKINLLQLIQSLQKENCDFNLVSKIIQTDPLLSYQLLKIANSAAFGGYQTIDSIDQAIARLGLVNLKNWVMLLSMKNISDKPLEILESGLIRAHMAQELAKTRSDISPQSAYTAGLLSIIDCILNKPMADLMSQITLATDIENALVTRSGPLGQLLSAVIAYEEGHWDEVNNDILAGQDLSKLYIDSLGLVTKSTKALHS